MITLADRVRKVWEAAEFAHGPACDDWLDEMNDARCGRLRASIRAALRELVEAWPDPPLDEYDVDTHDGSMIRTEALKVLEP